MVSDKSVANKTQEIADWKVFIVPTVLTIFISTMIDNSYGMCNVLKGLATLTNPVIETLYGVLAFYSCCE